GAHRRKFARVAAEVQRVAKSLLAIDQDRSTVDRLALPNGNRRRRRRIGMAWSPPAAFMIPPARRQIAFQQLEQPAIVTCFLVTWSARENVIAERDRLVQLFASGEDETLHQQHRHRGRVAGQQALDDRFGLVVAAALNQQRCAIVLVQRIGRFLLRERLERRKRLVGALEIFQRNAAIERRLPQRRLQLQRLVEQRQRLGGAIGHDLERRKVGQDQDVARRFAPGAFEQLRGLALRAALRL